MPVEVVLGDGKLSLERNTIIDVADNASVPDTLANAFARYYDVIFTHHTQQSRSSFPALTKLVVTLDSRDEELQYGVDESYALHRLFTELFVDMRLLIS
ncbi:beta-hexosaminidase 1-like isoform X4 [Physcomitrium patens]|uniref:beta-hexosaminidase 1-like isoform X4 n=1 Tax=Physcomitrium patens TaxID=3218 RepID=UPI00024AE7D1